MRKNLLSFICCLLFTAAASAQIPQGTVYLGSSLNLSDHSTDNGASKNHNSRYGFTLTAGKFVKDNWLLGINGSYFGTSGSNNVSKNTGWGAGVFVRKYKSLGKGFYFFGNLAANYSYQEYRS